MSNAKEPQKILFICLGNICRSPAAEGVLRSLSEAQGVEHLFEIDSAGTYGGHAGEQPDPRMRQAAFQRGFRLSHRSRQVTESDLEEFDRVIVMDDKNLRDVEIIAPSPEAKRKIERFADLVTEMPDIHFVPDPYYGGTEGFNHVLDILQEGCQRIIDQTKQ
ncbi:MAG: low molecular weight protein-tyrosine-phosphatase [Rikenellaceae bacterium]